MQNTHIGTKAALAALGLLLAASLCFAILENGRAESLSNEVDASYRRALYESAELLDGLQGSLLKLPASAGGAREQALLSDVAQQAFGVQQNLAALPCDAENLEGALKFVNQTRDYALALLTRLAEGGALTNDDQRQLSTLAESGKALQAELLASAETLDAVDFEPPKEAQGNQSAVPSVEYPSLIYDGPFSDGTKEGEMLALGEETRSADEAQEALTAYIGTERVQTIRYIGEILLPTPCYEFDVRTEYESLTACVTKTGGKVLYMLREGGSLEERLSEGECIDAGARFLESREYGAMQPTYWSREDGLLTINFAALQNGVLLYPDLVKVQVSMQTGLVVGIEARNYLRNHTQRNLPQARLTAEDALSRVSDRLRVTDSRLCVIPTDTAEAYVWEVSGDVEGIGSYLVYLDAMDGREVDILRLLQTESGVETQ